MSDGRAVVGFDRRLGVWLVVVGFGFFVLMRLLTIGVPTAFKVDAAQWTVSARSMFDDWVVWRTNDLTTSGPLNGLVIAWPILFGQVPSVVTTRLTGVILLALMLVGQVRMVRRGDGAAIGFLAVAVTAAALAFPRSVVFLHYASEILSVVLITGFCVVWAGMRAAPVAAKLHDGTNTSRAVAVSAAVQPAWRWFLCGLFATALPLAKLQSALFALLLHGLCCIVLARGLYVGIASRRAIAGYFTGSLLPFVLLVVPPLLVGEADAVLRGYLGLGANYGGVRQFDVFLEPSIWPFLVMMIALSVPIAWLHWRHRHSGGGRRDLLALAVALWPVTFVTIWWPGRPFPHYAFYALCALPIAVILAERALPPDVRLSRPVFWLAALATALLLLAQLTLAIVRPRQEPYWPWGDLAPASGVARVEARPLYGWLGLKATDTMLMWGWLPELPADAGVRSADRASHSEYLIRPNAGRDYFRQRLLEHYAVAPPTAVIDANRKDYFFGNWPQYRPERGDLHNFPELAALVARDYVPVVSDPRFAEVYLRRDRVAPWRAAEVPLTSSAAPLIDNSVTEHAQDWWAPPVGSIAKLAPQHPERLCELWILGSRGQLKLGSFERWVSVDIGTVDGKWQRQRLYLYDYPRWTVLRVNDARAVVALRIAPEQIASGKLALSEVKAFRQASTLASNSVDVSFERCPPA